MSRDYNQVSQPTRQPPKKPLTKCHRKSPHLCSNHPTTAPSTFGSAHMTASHHQISTLRRGLDHLRCIFNKSAVAGEGAFLLAGQHGDRSFISCPLPMFFQHSFIDFLIQPWHWHDPPRHSDVRSLLPCSLVIDGMKLRWWLRDQMEGHAWNCFVPFLHSRDTFLEALYTHSFFDEMTLSQSDSSLRTVEFNSMQKLELQSTCRQFRNVYKQGWTASRSASK